MLIKKVQRLFILFFIILSSSFIEAKTRLAIMDLQPVNLDKQTAITISEVLRTEVFNTGYFIVPERKEMKTILKEHELSESGMMDTRSAISTGKLLSAEKILIGTISKLGNSYIINVRVVDIELGVMDFALKQIVEKEELMALGCEMMAKNLVSKIKDDTIGDTVAREKKPWEASLELGAGTLFSATFSYYRIGLCSGFDFGKEEVENVEYSSYLIHAGLFYNLDLKKLLTKKIPEKLSLNVRPRVGVDFVLLDKYYTTAYELSPDLLLGFNNIYAILSPAYLICKQENIFLVQLGIGYRIIF